MLGEPDFSDGNEFGYTVESDFGSDIDPVFRKNLLLTINGDSMMRTVEVKEWRK